MKYKAVIFDLFGTLIHNFSEKEYRQIVMRMATNFLAQPEPFWEQWMATFKESILGISPDNEDKITRICRTLGVSPEQKKIVQTCGVLFDY